jgi:hypothetical protein
MAVVFSRQRPVGKIWPNGAGAIIAATIGGRRLGAFTSVALAIAASLDCADTPLTVDAWLAWFEELVDEEVDPSPHSADFDAPDQDYQSAGGPLCANPSPRARWAR